MADARSFQADLTKFANQLDFHVATVRRKVTLDLFEKISVKTPVDTGRLRASWAVSDGQPSDHVAPKGDKAARGPVQATFRYPYEASYIVNNLPYVLKIEFGGSPVKAPAGMVRVSMAEVIAELKGVTREL